MTVAMRSVRAEKITPRWPARADSRARFGALMDAVGRLLAKHGPSEITIQMIADTARMPTATVYHFFPSAEAALLAQAKIYISEFEALTDAPTPARERTSWQCALRGASQRSRKLYTNDVARMRLLLGADVPRDVQQQDAHGNVRIGAIIAAKLAREAYLDPIPNLDQIFTNAVEINDVFWRMSFQRTGTITDAWFEESLRATVAYLRTYLPDDLKYRPA